MTAPLRLVVDRGQDVVAMSLNLPSDLGLVGEAVELVARHCDTGVLSPRQVRFNLRTALAEALANAIVYGNRHDTAKFVRIAIELGRADVRICVSDDGDGFDPSQVPDPTAPEHRNRDDGRGLFVLRHLVDDVEFNERGNVVCLILRAG